MNLKNVNSVVFVGLLSFLLICTLPAEGSGSESAKCATPKFQAEFDNSIAVFVGEVVSDNKEGDIRTFEFKVIKFWKGIDSAVVKVAVYENPRFEAIYKTGREYLVFAKKHDDPGFFDGRCSRSAEVGGTSSSLEDDLEELGEARTCIELSNKEGK